MTNHVKYMDAWKDFFVWIKEQDIWKDKDRMPRHVKQYIDRANRDSKKGKLGIERAKGIIMQYASERYKFLDIVEVKGDLLVTPTT